MKGEIKYQGNPYYQESTAKSLTAVAADPSVKTNADVSGAKKEDLSNSDLLTENIKLKKQFTASQAKVKDLIEAVRYRDRKIRLGVTGGGRGKVVGSNVMDHSHLGEAKEVTVPAQAVAKPVATKVASTKAVSAKVDTSKKVTPVKH